MATAVMLVPSRRIRSPSRRYPFRQPGPDVGSTLPHDGRQWADRRAGRPSTSRQSEHCVIDQGENERWVHDAESATLHSTEQNGEIGPGNDTMIQ